MLIDEVLPTFDVIRVDTVVVTGSADDVYRAALQIDMVRVVREDPLVRLLFALRGVPDRVMRLAGRKPKTAEPVSMRLADLPVKGEWIRLGALAGTEIVFGAVGRFWNGPVEWLPSDPDTFATSRAPGAARIAANLAVHPYSSERVLVTYETRTAATDEASRRAIRRYWRVLSPFIGLVLRTVLTAIRREVEAASLRSPTAAGPPPAASHEPRSPGS